MSFEDGCFSCHRHAIFLLYLKHLHVPAVIAETSMIRQAFERIHEIDDKLTSNPQNSFEWRPIHSNCASNWCRANNRKLTIYNNTLKSKICINEMSNCADVSTSVLLLNVSGYGLFAAYIKQMCTSVYEQLHISRIALVHHNWTGLSSLAHADFDYASPHRGRSKAALTD